MVAVESNKGKTAMPVTAKLSKAFYDRLGEQATNELVEWFNAVDATYRSDLKEINELNFARFDAKQEQRFAAFEAKMERRFAAQMRFLYLAWAAQMAAIVAFGTATLSLIR